MRYSISNNAEYGDFTRGPRIITEESKNEMRRILKEIQTGAYAQEFLLENQTGATKLNALRRTPRHPIEVEKLRDDALVEEGWLVVNPEQPAPTRIILRDSGITTHTAPRKSAHKHCIPGVSACVFELSG
jgi:hypothetical protein